MTVDETADTALNVCLFKVLFLLPSPALKLVLKFNIFDLVIFQVVRAKGVHGLWEQASTMSVHVSDRLYVVINTASVKTIVHSGKSIANSSCSLK